MPIPGFCSVLVAIVSIAASALQVAAPAESAQSGGSVVCEKFGSVPVTGGRYVVQNDLWGADDPQCVRAFDTGFTVTVGNHRNTAQPAGYPSIFTGCHYGACTAGTLLPRAVRDLGPVASSWSYTVPPTGSFTAAYDIWFDPTPRRDGGVTGTELMIWLRTTGPAPIGRKVARTAVAGTEWDVWRGANGAQVISYVRTQPTDRVDGLDLSAFLRDATARGVLPAEWYLTSVQAGFEPWTGGAGLTTNAFSVTGVASP